MRKVDGSQAALFKIDELRTGGQKGLYRACLLRHNQAYFQANLYRYQTCIPKDFKSLLIKLRSHHLQ